MAQSNTDHKEVVFTRRVTAQPTELKEYIDTTMREQMESKTNKMVGAKFLKFCGKYELNRIAEDATKYAEWLQRGYNVPG